MGRRPKASPTTPRNEILLHFAKAKDKSKRTHHGVYSATGIGKQTVYDEIEKLLAMRMIREEKGEKWRTGHILRYYYLTPHGWFRIGLIKPELSRLAATEMKKLGVDYNRYLRGFQKVTQIHIDDLLETIQTILKWKQVWKGWSFHVTIQGDSQGRPTFSMDQKWPWSQATRKKTPSYGKKLTWPTVKIKKDTQAIHKLKAEVEAQSYPIRRPAA